MSLTKKDKQWLKAHHQNPFQFKQVEVMSKAGIKHRNDFYRKFYQVIISERKATIFND